MVEYQPPLLQGFEMHGRDPTFLVRPHRFSYRTLGPSDVQWTTGRMLAFRDRGRAFFVGVVVHGKTDTAIRRTVEDILDTITVGLGRCRPSAGVGSS
jgi:hypothetical protein